MRGLREQNVPEDSVVKRWTGRSMWIADWNRPVPRGWYPFRKSVWSNGLVQVAGCYYRERRRWWLLIVFWRVMRQATERANGRSF